MLPLFSPFLILLVLQFVSGPIYVFKNDKEYDKVAMGILAYAYDVAVI